MARLIERLEKRDIDAATEPGLLPDGDGLYLCVAKGGSKSWILRYRLAGKRRDMGLGRYPVITLADARDRANAQRRMLVDKIDPLERRRAERSQRAAVVKASTFEEIADRCIRTIRSDWKKDTRLEHNWRQSLRDYAFPVIGKMLVDQIESTDIKVVLMPIWLEVPTIAKTLRQRIERILNFAKAEGLRSGDNPAAWEGNLQDMMPKGQVRTKSHEALPYADAAAFLAELQDAQPVLAAKALSFTMLTAARSVEVRKATWPEFDLKARLWTVPAAHMKGGKEHKVPLSAAALAILTALPKDGDQPFKLGHAATRTLAKRLRPEITVHGLRSTFRSWGQDQTSFPDQLLEHCLAHITGDASELAYKRGDALEKRRAVMDAWASYCAIPTRW